MYAEKEIVQAEMEIFPSKNIAWQLAAFQEDVALCRLRKSRDGLITVMEACDNLVYILLQIILSLFTS